MESRIFSHSSPAATASPGRNIPGERPTRSYAMVYRGMTDTVKAFLTLLLLYIIPSFGDIATDVVNSLNMLGYNATDTILQPLENLTGSVCQTQNTDEIWGKLGIALMFFPGIFAFIFGIRMIRLQIYSFSFSILVWLGLFCLLLCFPVAMIFMEIGILICSPKKEDMKTILMTLITFEAFFESSPQLHLQIFTLIYGYELTTVQLVAICMSVTLLAKTAVMFDLLDGSISRRTEDLDWKQTLQLVCTLMPAYFTSMVFKIGSTSIQMAFLRQWSSIPITIQFLEMVIIGIIVQVPTSDLFLLVSSNMSVMNVCMADGSLKNKRRFVRWSSVVTYIHSSITLITILVLTKFYPNMLPHWECLHLHGIYLSFAITFLIIMGAGTMGHQQMWNTKIKQFEGKEGEENDEGEEEGNLCGEEGNLNGDEGNLYGEEGSLCGEEGNLYRDKGNLYRKEDNLCEEELRTL